MKLHPVKPFKLSVVVLAYHMPEQLAELLALLRHPRVAVYLHIDRAFSIDPFRRALGEVTAPDVTWLPRFRSRWGDIGVVDATLAGIRRALADGGDYLMLISGQDFPLRPLDEIVEFAAAAGSTSYVEHFALPDERWTYGGRERIEFYTYTIPVLERRETAIPRSEDTSAFSLKGKLLNNALRLRTLSKPERGFPAYLTPFGGWTWWNLSRSGAEHVIRFVDEHPDYREYHRYTFAPDEVFIPSIVANADPEQAGALANDDLRFIAGGMRDRHPPILTMSSLPAMLASDDLFARKFSPLVDPEVITELRGRVGG